MSTIQFRNTPSYNEQIAEGVRNNAHWYRYFQQIELGTPPSPEILITATASPFSYTAPKRGVVILSGGTVSSVMFSRTAGTFYLVGTTAGMYTLDQNDVLKITYTVKPTTLVWVPM